ncbi:MAG TPA: stage V sporulation protein AC [Syntrophomonadaceae bacterium]|nr:stage V sporulation protein AC [Syntrophomonadaceae bacterium]
MSRTTNDALKKIAIEEYDLLVQDVKPKRPLIQDCIWAFVVGGLICLIAQILQNYLIVTGLTATDARKATSVIMIFLAALTTGIGVYDKLGEKAGAGSIVPITGFANAIVASAIEYKREGYIFGVGARIFSVAGPTLVFGFVIAMLIGLIKVFISS